MTFASSHERAISTTASDEGGVACSIEDLAALVWGERSATLTGDNKDYTAFVVVKIPATAERTVTYGSGTMNVAEDTTSAMIDRGLVSNGNNTVNVEIGGDAEFAMSFNEITVPVGLVKGV